MLILFQYLFDIVDIFENDRNYQKYRKLSNSYRTHIENVSNNYRKIIEQLSKHIEQLSKMIEQLSNNYRI